MGGVENGRKRQEEGRNVGWGRRLIERGGKGKKDRVIDILNKKEKRKRRWSQDGSGGGGENRGEKNKKKE